MAEYTAVMRYVEKARIQYFKAKQKPLRYRQPSELERAEARLIQIECLAIELGYISAGTI